MKPFSSIPVRLTLITVVLLTACCVALTLVLNQSAYRLATDALQEPSLLEQAVYTPAIAVTPAEQLTPAENHEKTQLPLQPVEMAAITNSVSAQTYRGYSLVAMAAFVALGGALMYVSIHFALRPLQRVCAQMKNTSAGNLAVALPLPRREDEVYALTSAFNEMTHKLEQAFAAQKRFSANAAHELRTPLTAVRTSLEVFQKTPAHTPAEYDALLEKLQMQTTRLSSLVNSLLRFTNLEDIAMDDRVEPGELLALVCEEFAGKARERDVALRYYEKNDDRDGEAAQRGGMVANGSAGTSADADVNSLGTAAAADTTGATNAKFSAQAAGDNTAAHPLCVSGNAELLYQAFCNVVENAIRYNKAGGRVEISLLQENGQAVIHVDDTGIGIAPEHRAAVFEPFFTVDASRSRASGGAGIGLSLVQAIVQRHGGTVRLGDSEGGGTRVEIALPRCSS